jgi:hypothetical protein
MGLQHRKRSGMLPCHICDNMPLEHNGMRRVKEILLGFLLVIRENMFVYFPKEKKMIMDIDP